jgi:protein-S-isoprenylcysteine O-methyltransferase Ste14
VGDESLGVEALMTAEGKPVVFPPLLFLACISAGGLLQWFRPLPIAPFSFRAGMIAGWTLLIIAATMGGLALRELRRHHTSAEPGREPHQLVMSGPYRLTRNPLYVCQLLVAASFAMMFNSLWLVAAIPLLLLLLDRLVVVREEAVLLRLFPEDYAAYKARVRRWI